MLLVYRARYLNLGVVFWMLPSTWLMIGPVLQIYIPVLLYGFGWNTLPNAAEPGSINQAIAYWTVITAFIVLGAAIFEPYRALRSALDRVSLGILVGRLTTPKIARAAAIMLIFAIVARLSQGGIAIHEIQIAARVLGESAAVNTRVTMFILPLMILSTSLAAFRFVIAMKDGRIPVSVHVLFWCSLFTSTGYQILLGSRGGVLSSVFPSVLIITLLLNGSQRRRMLMIMGFLFVAFMLIADFTRSLTVAILAGNSPSSFSFFGLANALFDGFQSSNDVSQNAGDGTIATFFRRIGTGWILSNLMAHPESFPILNPGSFLRVYTVAFPSILSPWNAFIPYPTEHGIFDLGYIMGEIITGITGVGTAVPPQAEIYWRFGWLLGPAAAMIWGASIALLLRFWSRFSPELGLFLALFFSIQISLSETSWVLIANLVRNPILLMLALYAARARIKRVGPSLRAR